MSSRARLRDKWRLKKWYTVYAPEFFGNVAVGTTPADSPQKLIGRVIETTLYDITGHFDQQHVKLFFQIVRVEGENAYTIFKGHDFARDYLRSLVRRGSSRIDGIFTVETKDGYIVQVYLIALTTTRAKTSQERAIRKIMEQTVYRKAEQLNFEEFIQQAVLGKIASEVYNEAKKIHPLRKVEVYKTELLKAPILEELQLAA